MPAAAWNFQAAHPGNTAHNKQSKSICEILKFFDEGYYRINKRTFNKSTFIHEGRTGKKIIFTRVRERISCRINWELMVIAYQDKKYSQPVDRQVDIIFNWSNTNPKKPSVLGQLFQKIQPLWSVSYLRGNSPSYGQISGPPYCSFSCSSTKFNVP